MNPIAASYRDKKGYVFNHEEKIYRCISPAGKEDYQLLMNSGLYEDLVKNQQLIPHTEINDATIAKNDQAFAIIQPNFVPFISYPYEWSFATIKQAALLTLELTIKAIRYGMILKDATPLNIQFYNGGLIFIDTLSFEKYEEGQPWIAYRQFCESFLLPLLLLKYYPATKAANWYGTSDYVPLADFAATLPAKSKFNLAALLHIHLQSKYRHSKSGNSKRILKKQQLLHLLTGLQENIKKLNIHPARKNWAGYYQEDHSTNYYTEKKERIASFLKSIPHSNTGADIGCNTGFFSQLLSGYCAHIVSTDSDSICVHRLQENLFQENKNIVPLVIDFCNPSPATGLDGRERLSFFDRMGQVDILLFLALAHHIVLSNNVPLPMLSKSLSEKGHYLIIEFCSSDDEKVKEIMARKKYHHEWNELFFEQCFDKYFVLLKKELLGSNSRILYFFKLK